MLFHETKRFDLILEKEEKKPPKKCNGYKILSIIFLIIIIGGIFTFIFYILTNQIKNCRDKINEKFDNDEKQFKNIFVKLKEIENKISGDITSLNNKINEIQNQN